MLLFSPLRPGDSLAVIAPAGRIAPEKLDVGIAEIVRAGFVPLISPQCRMQHGRFAGTDDVRRDALHEAYANPEVKAILCARGGYGAQRFVDGLDFDLIAKNPKPLCGYSDVTTLLNTITQRTGQVTFHAPMVGDVTAYNSPESWTHLWQVLTGADVHPSDHPAVQQCRILREGHATGRLLGGNLTILAADCGTPSYIKPEILFFEEVGEDLYRFDRMLWQLKRAGVFAALRGVLVGELLGVEDKGEPAFGTDAEGILMAHFGDMAVPVVANLPAGHCCHRTTLPIGAEVTVEAQDDQLHLSHAPFFG